MKLPSCALPDLMVRTEAAPRKQFNINRNRCDEIIIRAAIMHGIQNQKTKERGRAEKRCSGTVQGEKDTREQSGRKKFHLSSPVPRRAR